MFSLFFKAPTQTDPPTVAISDLFLDGNFPLGEVVNYNDEYVADISPIISWSSH